jgi:hypothetical protein
MVKVSNITKALHECCNYKAPAIILNTAARQAYRARLASLSGSSVALEVWEDIAPLLAEPRLGVSFVYRGNSCAFFATVLEYLPSPPPQVSRLVLEIPTKIVGIDARLAQRVPIKRNSGLRVRVTTRDGRSWAPRPIDLSLTGILIEFPAGKTPDLAVGSKIELELCLGSEVAELTGEVRRRIKHQYGLFFRKVFSKRGISPPLPLRRIVETLSPGEK